MFACFLCVFVLFAYKKTENVIQDSLNTSILEFETQEDFNKILQETMSLSHEDRKLWEIEHSFKSFGYKCDELYFSIVPEQFNSTNEVI